MADVLDPGMLPDWLREMDPGSSMRPGAEDISAAGLEWCGSFTVHGLGFQSTDGTETGYAMAWPLGDGSWQVLEDAYDIDDPANGPDIYIETPLLSDIVRENGWGSLSRLESEEGPAWRKSFTRAVAARRCRERFIVPNTYREIDRALNELVGYAARLDRSVDIESMSVSLRNEMLRQASLDGLALETVAMSRSRAQLRGGKVAPRATIIETEANAAGRSNPIEWKSARRI